MTFGEKLQYMRRKKDWSQEEFAVIIGVSRQAVSKWELGTVLPDGINVVKIAELFGVSTDWLLKDDMEQPQYAKRKIKFSSVYSMTDFIMYALSACMCVAGIIFYVYRMFYQWWNMSGVVQWENFNFGNPVLFQITDEIVIIAILLVLFAVFLRKAMLLYMEEKI